MASLWREIYVDVYLHTHRNTPIERCQDQIIPSIPLATEDDSTYFCGIDFSTLIYQGKPLFEMGAMDQLQLDFEDPLKRTTSWSNWDGRVPRLEAVGKEP